MSYPDDSLFQNFSTVQNKLQPTPTRLAAASDMNEGVTTFVSFISGTDAIATIDPPVSGSHMLVLIFTNANPGGVTTGGNINGAVDPAQYAPVILFYDPVGAKYYAGKLAVG